MRVFNPEAVWIIPGCPSPAGEHSLMVYLGRAPVGGHARGPLQTRIEFAIVLISYVHFEKSRSDCSVKTGVPLPVP